MSSFYSDLTGDSHIDANAVYSDNITVQSELDMSNATVIGDLLPNVDNSYNLGSNSLRWANVYANSSFHGPSINVDLVNNYTTNNLVLQASNGTGQVNDDFTVVGLSKLHSLELNANNDQIVYQTFW